MHLYNTVYAQKWKEAIYIFNLAPTKKEKNETEQGTPTICNEIYWIF